MENGDVRDTDEVDDGEIHASPVEIVAFRIAQDVEGLADDARNRDGLDSTDEGGSREYESTAYAMDGKIVLLTWSDDNILQYRPLE